MTISSLTSRASLALRHIGAIVLYPTIMILGVFIFLICFIIGNIYAALAYLTGSTTVAANRERIIDVSVWPMEWVLSHLDRLLKI